MKASLLGLMIICLTRAPKTRSHEVTLSCNCGWWNRIFIIAGREIGENQYPWMVTLSNGCGGSLITQHHVLTAAHCTDGFNPSSLVVSVGRHNQTNENESNQHRVERIEQHKGFSRTDSRRHDDISIIVLADPITFTWYVWPVCLINYRYHLEGKVLKVTGWGSPDGDSNFLREVDVEEIPREICIQTWPHLHKKTQLCTYTPRQDICTGDSGGALVYLDPDTNMYTQVGLASYENKKCGSKPAVHTDVHPYLGWIREVTESQPKAQYCTKIIKENIVEEA